MFSVRRSSGSKNSVYNLKKFGRSKASHLSIFSKTFSKKYGKFLLVFFIYCKAFLTLTDCAYEKFNYS